MFNDKENILEATKKFMNGTQHTIFEKVVSYLESNNANFDYISSDNLKTLSVVAESPAPYKGVLMQDAKSALDNIQHEVLEKQQAERIIAEESIANTIAKLKQFSDFAKLDGKQQLEIIAPFEKAAKEIDQERFIGNIRSKKHYINNELYQRQLEKMTAIVNPPKPVKEEDLDGDTPKPTVQRIAFVNKNSVKVNFKKPALETKQDVEDYLAALKEQYFRIIDEDKRISL